MKVWAAIAACAGLAVVPPAASAHSMPTSTAFAVAKKAVAKVVRDTHASSGRVTSCKRQSSHRFLCKGETHYRAGASRCTFDIKVRYTSRTKRTTASSIANYRCF
jgi:hypothetical protein